MQKTSVISVCECGSRVRYIHKHMKRTGHTKSAPLVYPYEKRPRSGTYPIKCACGMLVTRMDTHVKSKRHADILSNPHSFIKCTCDAIVHMGYLCAHVHSIKHYKNMIKYHPDSAIDAVINLSTPKPQYTLTELADVLDAAA